jgi:hypothetical protein
MSTEFAPAPVNLQGNGKSSPAGQTARDEHVELIQPDELSLRPRVDRGRLSAAESHPHAAQAAQARMRSQRRHPESTSPSASLAQSGRRSPFDPEPALKLRIFATKPSTVTTGLRRRPPRQGAILRN